MQQQTVPCQSSGLERRGFIAGGIYTLVSLIGGTLAASAGRYLFGTPRTQEAAWADAGDISDLPAGRPHEITFARSRVDGWKIRSEKTTAWIILDNKREVTAFSPLCTHLGCAYHWQAQSKTFSCPCHGSAFGADGDVISGPAGRPLDRYTVKVEGRRLWLGPLQGTQKS